MFIESFLEKNPTIVHLNACLSRGKWQINYIMPYYGISYDHETQGQVYMC